MTAYFEITLTIIGLVMIAAIFFSVIRAPHDNAVRQKEYQKRVLRDVRNDVISRANKKSKR